MRPSAPVLTALALTLAAATMACGETEETVPETSESADLPELDACDLFTAEDASAVLGVPAAPPEGWTRIDNRDERTGVALSNCLYTDAEGRRTAHVLVTHSVRGGYPTSWEELEASSASGSGIAAGLGTELIESSEPAPVGGEFGYWTPDLGTLTVFADERWTIAATVDPPTRGDLAAARSAAERAVERVLDRL